MDPRKLRYISVYGFAKSFDPISGPEMLSHAIENLGIAPNKIAFFTPREGKNGKWRKNTANKKVSIHDILRKIEDYSIISIDHPINGNFLSVESHIALNLGMDYYAAYALDTQFSIDKVLEHIHLILKFMQPRYGFSDLTSDLTPGGFASGSSDTNMDDLTARRAAYFGLHLRGDKEFLLDRIYDVFPLNLINVNHIERKVDGRSLREIIEYNGYGKLSSVGFDLFAWIVEGVKRDEIRKFLFEAGELLAPV